MNNRQEQIEQARRLIATGISEELVEVLRQQFPELKESEDEKIRKELYEFIKVNSPTEDANRFIAWLEKQKEQKPAEKISVSEELYEHIRNTCACIDDAMSSDTMCDMTDYLEMANSSAQKAFDMVDKSVVKQPAEWSEKDLQHKSWILECLADGERKMPEYAEDFRAAYNWLKSLRPQLKREDWTDEDSLAIKEIQNALQIYMLQRGISEKQRKKLARWLDIHCNAYPIPAKLYPHWKPSKEQINALHAFVGMIHPDARYDAVFSLLDELKAL